MCINCNGSSTERIRISLENLKKQREEIILKWKKNDVLSQILESLKDKNITK